jgi:hypothetical protein
MATLTTDPNADALQQLENKSHRITLSDGRTKVQSPLVGLYTNLPANAKCMFSLNQRNRERRVLAHVLPPRRTIKWTEAQVRDKANSIMVNYPHEWTSVHRFAKWVDLYQYFDCHDLFYLGAWNLRDVVNLLYEEKRTARANARAQAGLAPHFRAEIEDWVYRWMTWDKNRHKLATWNRNSDVLSIMDREDWKSIHDEDHDIYLDQDALNHVRRCLEYYHEEFFSLSPKKHSAEAAASASGPEQAQSAEPSIGTFSQRLHSALSSDGSSSRLILSVAGMAS